MAGPVNELKAKFGANATSLLSTISKLKSEMSNFAKSTASSLNIANSSMKGFDSSVSKLKTALSGLGQGNQFKGLTSALEAAQREFRETGQVSENTMRMVKEEADKARIGLTQLGNQGGQSLNQLESHINEAENELHKLAGTNLNGVTSEIDQLGDTSADTTGDLNRLGQAGDNADLTNLGSDANRAGDQIDQLGDAANQTDRQLSDLGRETDLNNITTDANRAGDGLEDLVREADRAEDALDDLGNGGDLNPLINDVNRVEREMDGIGDAAAREARQAESAFSSLRGKIMGLVGAYVGFEVISEGARLAGNSLIMANADMETYENTLTTVLKSNEKAKETLDWASSFAGTTPFEIPEIVEATTRLSAYGMTASDVMTDVGNMASVMGTPLMQAVEAVADAQTGELERLKEFGITKQMLIDKAKEMGNTEVVNAKGQIVQQEQFNDALFALMQDRYSGGMEMQSKTFKGLISNVKDGLGTMGRELGKPIFEKFKSGLQSVVPAVSGFTELVKGNAGEASKIFTDAFGAGTTAKIMSFINGAKSAFSGIKDFVMGLMPTFQNLWTVFSNVASVVLPPLIAGIAGLMQILPPILSSITGIAAKFTEWSGFAPILAGIVASFVTYKTAMTAINAVQKIYAGITAAVTLAQTAWTAAMIASAAAGGGLRGVMAGMRAAMIALNLSMLANPVVAVIAAIVGLGVALVVAYQKSETFRNFVQMLWDKLKGAGQWIADFFTTTIPAALSAFGAWITTFFPNLWNTIISGIVSFGAAAGGFFSAIWNGYINILITFWSTVWNLVQTGFNFIVTIFQTVGATISSVASSIWNFVSTAFMNGVNTILSIFSPLVEWFSVYWNSIKAIFLSIVLAIISLVTGNFSDLQFALKSIWQAIKNMFNATITAIKQIAINLFTALKDGVVKIFNSIKTTSSNIWNSIKSTASSIWNSLKSTVVNAANSLKSGAVNAWNSLKSGVVNAANSLKSGAVSAWNSLKSSVVNAANSLKSGAVNAFNSLRSSASSIVSGIRSTVTNGFNSAKSAAINAFNALKSGVSNAISGVKSTVTGMKNSILSTIRGINLRSIGVNIINGLRDGIASAAGAVMDKARSIANNIKDTIAGALKIKSPSREMIKLMGFVGEGLEIGLENSEKGTGKAAASLANNIYDKTEAGLKNTLQRVSEIAGNISNAVNDNMNFNGALIGGSVYGESLAESRIVHEHSFDLQNVPEHIDQGQLEDKLIGALQNPRVQTAIDRATEKVYGRTAKPLGKQRRV